MKKFTIAAGVVVIGILIFFFLFRRHPGQTETRTTTSTDTGKLFTGNWIQQDSMGSLILHSQGGFARRIQHGSADGTQQWLYEGTWDFKDGVLVLNISNAVARNTTNIEPIGSVDNFKV